MSEGKKWSSIRRWTSWLPPWTPTVSCTSPVAVVSYERWAGEEFKREHDHFKLLGEDNIRRYLPVDPIRVRLHPDDTAFELLARVAAALVVGARVVVSSPHGNLPDELHSVVERLEQVTEGWGAAIEFVHESDEQLAETIATGLAGRIRYAAADRVPASIRVAAAKSLDYIADAPVSSHGRVELLWYVREQAISFRYHRYGNLGFRTNEERDEPA